MASTMLSLSFAAPSLRQSQKKEIGCAKKGSLFGNNKGGLLFKGKSLGRVSMSVAVNVSRFEGITMAPPDPILGVSEAFRADTSDMKLNLGVGAYRTEELQPYVLTVVKKAENLMLEKGDNKEYLPIEGLAAFNKATVELLLGADNPAIQQGRVATVQGLSGTGSLRLAAAFIHRYFPDAKAMISSPTWGNHKNIFNDARVPWSEYRYYDPRTVGLDFDGMIADIKAAPDGSFVVLHGCAHNPTGIDPTPEQWETIAASALVSVRLRFSPSRHLPSPMTVSFSDLHTEAGVKALDVYLTGKVFIAGKEMSKDDVTVYAFVPKDLADKFPNVRRWYNTVASTLAARFPGAPVGVSIGGTASVAGISKDASAAEDDDLDLFGDETEEEQKAAAEREAAIKAKPKKKQSGKSSVVLDVKPWDDETDMKKLEEIVRSIEMPGLLWGASKLAAVGYGIKKLQIMMTIVDDLVSVDDLIEDYLTVEPANEYVQSCDIVVFNKI